MIDGGVKIEMEGGVAPAERGYPVEAEAGSSLWLVLGRAAGTPLPHMVHRSMSSPASGYLSEPGDSSCASQVSPFATCEAADVF